MKYVSIDPDKEPFYVTVPIKCPSDPNKEIEFRCPIALPHELYALLAESLQSMIRTSFRYSRSTILSGDKI